MCRECDRRWKLPMHRQKRSERIIVVKGDECGLTTCFSWNTSVRNSGLQTERKRGDMMRKWHSDKYDRDASSIYQRIYRHESPCRRLWEIRSELPSFSMETTDSLYHQRGWTNDKASQSILTHNGHRMYLENVQTVRLENRITAWNIPFSHILDTVSPSHFNGVAHFGTRLFHVGDIFQVDCYICKQGMLMI